MTPVPLAEISAADWDAVVAASPQGWVFHRRSWISIETGYGGARCLSFGLMSGGRLVAVQPLYCSQVGLGAFVETLIHTGLHRHTGLALLPGLQPEKIAAARSIAMNAIVQAAGQHDADRIYLAHQNLAPQSLSVERREIPFWVIDYGFELGNSFGPVGIAPAPGLATTVVDQIVDLTQSEEMLFARLEESCRRAIRKGLKAGLQTSDLGTSSNHMDEYWRLANLSAERTGEQLPDRGYYETICAELGPLDVFDVVFVASSGAPVAAAILLRDKGACHFLSGVSDPAHLANRVNDVLHWSAILHAKKKGDAVYRLGPYFPSVPRGWPIETVTRFKSKFGATPWTIVQGSRYLKPERYSQLAQAHVARLCSELAR